MGEKSGEDLETDMSEWDLLSENFRQAGGFTYGWYSSDFEWIQVWRVYVADENCCAFWWSKYSFGSS